MLEFLLMGGWKPVTAGGLGFGLFGGGYNGANTAYTDRYTYANNAVAPGTVLGLARYYLAASSSSPGGF
jgi:hypothetical protein